MSRDEFDADLALLNLDEIVRILVDEFDVPAEVAMTGGGVATIFAGVPWIDEEEAPRYPAVAGPGHYHFDGGPSVASLSDFWIGPDDDGETEALDAAGLGIRTERDAARVIASQSHVRPLGDVLDADNIEALGFDPTLRGIRPEATR